MIQFYDTQSKTFINSDVTSIALNVEIFNPDDPLTISSDYSFSFTIPTSRNNMFIITSDYDSLPINAIGKKKDIVLLLDEQSIYGYISVESLDNGMLTVRFISYISKLLSTLDDITVPSLPMYDLLDHRQTFTGLINRSTVIQYWNNCLTPTEDKYKVFQFIPGYNMEQVVNFDTDKVYNKTNNDITTLDNDETEYAMNDIRSYSMRVGINVKRLIHSISKLCINNNEPYRFEYDGVTIDDKDFIVGNRNPSNQDDYQTSTSSVYLNQIYNFRSINSPIATANRNANVDIKVDLDAFRLHFSSMWSRYSPDLLYPLAYFKTSDQYNQMVRFNAICMQIVGDTYSTIQVFTSWPTDSEYYPYAQEIRGKIKQQLSSYATITGAKLVNPTADNIEFVQTRLKFDSTLNKAQLVNTSGESIVATLSNIEYTTKKPLRITMFVLPTLQGDTVINLPTTAEFTQEMFIAGSSGLLGVNNDPSKPFANHQTFAHLSETINFELDYNEALYVTGEDLRLSRYFNDCTVKSIFLDYLKVNNLNLVQTADVIRITNEIDVFPTVVYNNVDAMLPANENDNIKLIQSNTVDYTLQRIINSKVTGYQQPTSTNRTNSTIYTDMDSYSGTLMYSVETLGVGDLYSSRSALFGSMNNYEDPTPKILFNNDIPVLCNIVGMSEDSRYITDFDIEVYEKNSGNDLYITGDPTLRTLSPYPLCMPYRTNGDLLMVGSNDEYLQTGYTFKPRSGTYLLSTSSLRALSELNRYKLTINNFYIGDLTTCFHRMIFFDTIPFRLVQVLNYNTETKSATAIFVSKDIIK